MYLRIRKIFTAQAFPPDTGRRSVRRESLTYDNP